MVSPRREFFEAAFGRTAEEFIKIASMPEKYIIFRRDHEKNGAFDWSKHYDRLTENQRKKFWEAIADNTVTERDISRQRTKRMREILRHSLEWNR